MANLKLTTCAAAAVLLAVCAGLLFAAESAVVVPAAAIDNPKGSRAVGLANGRNPISVVVPCHRVIGASGDLTGYGGGLDRKRWLLAHESARTTADDRLF